VQLTYHGAASVQHDDVERAGAAAAGRRGRGARRRNVPRLQRTQASCAQLRQLIACRWRRRGAVRVARSACSARRGRRGAAKLRLDAAAVRFLVISVVLLLRLARFTERLGHNPVQVAVTPQVVAVRARRFERRVAVLAVD
jgi:hypothetical protein